MGVCWQGQGVLAGAPMQQGQAHEVLVYGLQLDAG